MPLSSDSKIRSAQEKLLRGEELSIGDKVILRGDYVRFNIDGYDLKCDCVYRSINESTLKSYLETGFVYGTAEDDEYQEYQENGQTYNNNRGVDWYLGGASLRYGNIVIECPADKRFFIPAQDNGNGTSSHPNVRHMKSSGFKNPVPMNMVRIIKQPSLIIDNDVFELNQNSGHKM